MADTAGRQMGLPLYAVLKGKTMNIMSLLNALPGAVAQGLIWGIMAIGVYITFRILDFADLTVDGSLCTGGAVCIMMMLNGQNVWVAMFAALLAGMVAGCVTGLLHTFMGIPAILSGILTQLGLYSINLKIMGKANQAINVDKYSLLVSLRFIRNVPLFKNTILLVSLIIVVLIVILYWFFGTELGCSIRATGCNDKMARAQGINTDFNRVLGLMISNGMVALSGALLSQYHYRSGCCYHRRSNFRKDLQKLWLTPFKCCFRFHYLLSGSSDSHLAGNRYRPVKAAVCSSSSHLPGNPNMEGTLFFNGF